ncbi:MAG: PIG-L family deacetylase [Mycobacteriaceae bacterium]|nr:PIG-L family deacetylase [Mycobacteriaceae bacterium]
MIDLRPERIAEVAALGAHCDDIAIGAGGTLLTLAKAVPGLTVRVLVLTGGATAREQEERAALADFCPGARVEVTVLDLPDGRTPAHWDRVKQALADFRRGSAAQVVFAPQPGDAHQDHRLLARLAPTEFRDQLVLGYEIVKWETDTARPTMFHPLHADVLDAKIALLHKHYASQVGRDWFDEETFRGLARLRGVQCRARYAEAFTADKTTLRIT